MMLVSIALPVYNGEAFIEACLDSILAQTFAEFELIICDNASTDRTAEICQSYVKKDPRVRYFRGDENIGAARNFNWAFELSKGEFFKWAAHDDVLAPEFLSACVEMLKAEPTAVLCAPRVTLINDSGDEIEDYNAVLPHARSPLPACRFRDVVLTKHSCYEVFGLMRQRILAATPLIGSYLGSDRNLLAEMALKGCFAYTKNRVLRIRDHKNRSVRIPRRERLKWFDTQAPAKAATPYVRQLNEYRRAVSESGLTSLERLRCNRALTSWAWRNKRGLISDMLSMGSRSN